MARLVSFVVLLAILILIAVLFFRVMAGFLLPLFLAALLGVVFQPLYRWTLLKCRGQRYVAATFTVLMVLVTVLAPAALVFTLAGAQGAALATQVQGTNVRQKLDELRSELSLDIPHRDDLQRIETTLKYWRDELRKGVTPEYSDEVVGNLLKRLSDLEAWRLSTEATGVSADPIRERLAALIAAPKESAEADRAIQDAYNEFRIYKRELLGGAYQATIKELVNPTDEQIEAWQKNLFGSGSSPLLPFAGDTLLFAGKLLLGTIIIIATLFFLFAEGSRMLDAAIRLSPLEERYVRELVSEFDRVCRAVVVATLLSAVAQGILAGIGFYICGLSNSVALLMLLTMVLAMVPFTGAASVWVPVCLYLWLYMGEWGWAVFLACYGTLVISAADNVIKPWVLHGQSNLHPLLALLSVIGGLQALGPIGILVGPMVVVFLQTLLKILQRELMTMDKLSAAAAAIGVPLSFGPRPATAPASPLPLKTAEPVIDPASGLPTEDIDDEAKPNNGSPAHGGHAAPQRTRPASKRKKKR